MAAALLLLLFLVLPHTQHAGLLSVLDQGPSRRRDAALYHTLWQGHPPEVVPRGAEPRGLYAMAMGGEAYACRMEGVPEGRGHADATPAVTWDDLRGVCASLNLGGYWTFVWCHEEEVAQVHFDDDGAEDGMPILLGSTVDTTMAGHSRVDLFGGGDECESGMRSAQVSFKCCHASTGVAALVSVTEPHTCQYDLEVCTLAACPPATTPNTEKSLAPLFLTCLHFHESWWSYEVCPGKGIRQFHMETTPDASDDGASKVSVTQEYHLGRAPAPGGAHVGFADFSTSETVVDEDEPSRSYVSLKYDDGGTCDGEGVDAAVAPTHRSSELRLVCPPALANAEVEFDPYGSKTAHRKLPPARHGVVSVSEPSTCSYVVVVHTPLVCHLKGFTPVQQRVLRPVCDPVDGTGPVLGGWQPPTVL